MRAIAVPDHGVAPAPTDLPVRECGPGELLVRIRASSVNGFDVAVLSGMLRNFLEHRFPIVPGKDFAGTVEAVGPGASRFAVGDAVFGVVMTPYVGADGTFAEYVVVSEQYGVARVPDGVPVEIAGALGLAGSAAVTALDALALNTGQTVLITGATGGVGAIDVQYAAAAGVRVLATARPGEEADLVRELGADATLDYTGDLAGQLAALAPEGVDAVIHLAGDPRALVELLAPGGCLASTLMFGADQHPAAVSIIADPTQATLDRLAADVAAGRLRVPITRTYDLADAPQALADFPKGTLGKYAIAVG